MNKLQLLKGSHFETSSNLIIKHPKLCDIDKFGEYDYSNFVQLFCASPRDMMVVLFDSGIKFSEITQFQLFRILFSSYYASITDIFEYFTGLKNPMQSEENIMFYDGERMVIIDEETYEEISSYLKLVTGFENKKNATFMDDYTMEMFVEAEKEDMEFAAQQDKSASMDDLITALVLETAYTFENIFDLYMYQFNKLIRKMIKKTDYNNLMIGVYTGNIDMKKLSKDKLNWLSS